MIAKKDDHFELKHFIVPKARVGVHQTILEWFATQKPGKVLDAPAGYGYLGLKLQEMGHDVTCGEINPGIFMVGGLKCIYTDLNQQIDVASNTFDYVCCVDGLEHMTNPFQAVKEFSRVLKPGGIGVFSIPNYSNIEKRFKFLIHGYLTKPTQIDAYLAAKRQLYDFHNSPLTITQLDFIFKINHFEMIDIKQNMKKPKQKWIAPFVYFLQLLNRFNSEKNKKKHMTSLTLDKRVILGGNCLIFIARKITNHPSPAAAQRPFPQGDR
jgi:2-polyprenyl-3-methyl-5-hydroxy-6-metoxy-1,4-benzoquinol methylase